MHVKSVLFKREGVYECQTNKKEHQDTSDLMLSSALLNVPVFHGPRLTSVDITFMTIAVAILNIINQNALRDAWTLPNFS